MFGLFARNAVLGTVAIGFAGVVLVGLIVAAVAEVAAMSRLSRIDTLQSEAAAALAGADRPRALTVLGGLDKLYADRPELSWARETVTRQRDDLLDTDALLALAERELMAPLDAAAVKEIEVSSRNVAAATAIVPLALADVVLALAANVRMVRRIAEIYGGRGGTFGSWRLMRAVAQHLVATGAVAVGDDLIGSVAGGGALSRISRRFGEGVVNGALTARVGVAAMEVCRPLPFQATAKPRVTALVKSALAGIFSKNGAASNGQG